MHIHLHDFASKYVKIFDSLYNNSNTKKAS